MDEDSNSIEKLKSAILKAEKDLADFIDSIGEKMSTPNASVLGNIILTPKSNSNINAENIAEFLSTDNEIKFNELIEIFNNDIDIILSLLSIKIDIMERNESIYQNKDSYNEMINKVKDIYKTNLSNFINEQENKDFAEVSETIEKLDNFCSIIANSASGIGEPSCYCILTLNELFQEKFKTFPVLTQAGNTQSLLLKAAKYSEIEKNLKLLHLIEYSSNSNQKLPINRKSTLYEERANNTENTDITRGNINYISDLIRYYIIYNYQIEYEDEVIYRHREKNVKDFNSHFFKMFKEITENVTQNKNNPELIKKINYMLNCPININSRNYTTFADFVENELKYNEKLTKEQREIFENFAKVMGIEQDQELNIPGLKLMDSKEATLKYGSKIEKETQATPEFMVEIYGPEAIECDKLKEIVENGTIIIDNETCKYLINNNFTNFSNLTLTLEAFQTAVNNQNVVLEGIKIETKDKKINENDFKIMYYQGYTDFSNLTFDGNFSKESRQEIAEAIGFSDIVEYIENDVKKINFFTSANKIKNISEHTNEALNIMNKLNPKDILGHEILEELEKLKNTLNKHNNSNFIMKFFRKNNLIKQTRLCSKLLTNTYPTNKNKMNNHIIPELPEENNITKSHFRNINRKQDIDLNLV